MSETAVEYVEKTSSGAWRITGSRVSLDSVVYAYWEGQSPEAIAEAFPTLSVEYVYGAIAFYLRHKKEVDHFLSEQTRRWEHLQASSQAQHGPLLERIRSSRALSPGDESVP